MIKELKLIYSKAKKVEQKLQRLLLYQKMIKVDTSTLGKQSVLFFTKEKGGKES